MSKFYCKTCDRFYNLKAGPNYLVVCPFCKEYVGSESDYGFGPIAPCTVSIGEEVFGEILPVDGYTLVSEKFHVREWARGGYKDLECYKSAAETVKAWLTEHQQEHEWFKERNESSRSRYTYTDLYVFALLYGVGLQDDELYKEALDEILMADPEDEDAIELKYETIKNAVLHTFRLMEERDFDKTVFGKRLMGVLAEYFKGCDLKAFADSMYKLWGFLPYRFSEEKPFHYLFSAGDHLSYGNRGACYDELATAFHYYDEE